MSGEDIYRNFTEARGGEGLAGAAEMVKQLVGEYEQQADEIIHLTEAMESAWQGDAAGAAQRGAGPLAVAHAQAAPEIDKAQDLSMRQVGSFGDAKSAVRPVPPEPTTPDPWLMVFAPDVTATYAKQVAAYNAASQHNVDVMSGYDNASSYNTSRLPNSYGTLVTDNASMSVGSQNGGPDTPPQPGNTDGGGRSRAGSAEDDPRTGSVDQPGSGAGNDGGGSVPVPGGGLVGPSQPGPGSALPPQQGTDPGSFQPPTIGPGGPLPPGSAPVPGGQGGGGLGVGVIGPVGGLGLGAGGGPGAEVGPGVGGRGGGAGAEGGRPSGGRGAVGSIGGGLPGEGGAGRGAGARAGLGGMPLGGAGVGKGRCGEDEEHERASFLQEPDPEATFGTDERTAPPVIQ